MLRQAIFVVVLVGAAFAGGAAINGPGLAWLQRNLIGGPTIVVDASAAPGKPENPGKRFPTATAPSLPFGFDPPATPPTPAASPALAATPPDVAGANASAATGLLGLPEPTGPELAAVAAASAPPLVTSAPDNSPPLAATPATSLARPSLAKSDPVTRLASSEGSDAPPPPATMPAPAPAGLSLSPAPAPAPGPGRDWTEIRQQLKTLGVSRYTVEAELEGRVRFECVIPVDGLRAVGHHFEAEGDDIFQAVDATIRRITLWRATEPTPNRIEP